MEASTLRHASRSGLLARRTPLLRLQSDERLVALIRAGHDSAFEVLFDRYHARLLAFCRHMLRSSEDAEDVLQEVFTNAHAAILGDNRHINVRPWLYRIARNRSLNHLRKPVAEGQDSMDVHPHAGGTTTAERVQRREDFRALVSDVQDLPETQRTALLLREIEALAYEEIAAAMDTTVPAVKSLLVRARMSLAESTQSRLLTCGDVQLELAEAAEGLRKASGPVRQHVRRCEACGDYRSKLRSNRHQLAALGPAALLVWLHKALGTKLFGGSTTLGAGSSAAAGGGAAAAGGGAALSGAAAAAGGAAGGIGGAIGTKAVAGLATAALITAGAVEVRHLYKGSSQKQDAPAAAVAGSAAAEKGVLESSAASTRNQRSRPAAAEASPPAAPAAAAEAVDDPAGATAAATGETTSTSSDATPTATAKPPAAALGSAVQGSGGGDSRSGGSSVTPPATPVDPPAPPAEGTPPADQPADPPAEGGGGPPAG